MERRNSQVDGEPPTISMTTPRSSRGKPPTPRTIPFVRTRGLSAVAATLAIVVLSAALFGMLSSRHQPGIGAGPTATTPGTTPTVTPGATPTATPATGTGAQLQTLPGLPDGDTVLSISMDGPNDGWAVGANQNETAGVVLHYTRGRWVPVADAFPGVTLADVSMDSPDDGWAVGTRFGQNTGVVLHYTGGHWTEVNAPIRQFAGAKVWAISPSQAWVVANVPPGQSSTQQGFSQSSIWLSNRSGGLASVLLLYNQGSWSQFNSPSGISDISLLSPDDIWASTYDASILHFQAGHWTQFPMGHEGGQPLALSMTSDSDGWVAGFANASPQGMFLAHFDGSQWMSVQGPASSGPTSLWTVDMVSASDGWVGGDMLALSGPQTVLLHYVDGRWQQVPLNYNGTIESIFMVSATEGWAAVSGGKTSGLLHYYNGTWTPYDPGQ